MEPFLTLTAKAAPFPSPNVNTDVIMPKRFLKIVDRKGLAAGVFADLRFTADGAINPDFILHKPGFDGTRFLVVGDNFGCGSSREHAVWGLYQLGIRALIGTTFGGIFFDNCRRNGILAICLDTVSRDRILHDVSHPEKASLTIRLEQQRIEGPDGAAWEFEIAPSQKTDLLEGRDAISDTLNSAAAIREYEARWHADNPWLARSVE